MNNTSRLLAALLVASLVGNVALLFRAAKSPSSAALSGHPAESSRPFGPSAATAASAPSPEAAAALSRALSAASLTEFRDLLVAAGIEPKLRREMLQLLLQNRYAERFHSLYTDKAELAQTPWWRNPDYRELNSSAIQLERQKQGLSLQKQFESDLAALTGQDPRALDFEENPWLERQYAGIPRPKAEALFRLQQDYDELEQQVRGESMNFQLPTDEEKLRLLRAERERDIAALLSPEERAAWELKSSPTADRTRDLATRYRATEDEYRRIYALQKAYDERFHVDEAGFETAENDWEKRNAGQQELQKQIRAIVGEERYLASQQENDQDYNLARFATERLGLPEETTATIYSLREPVAQSSQRIATDASLSPAQKRDALAKLAADTRAQVERTLGREAAALYFQRGGMRWLEEVGRGSRIELNEDGEVQVSAVAGVEPEPAPVPIIRID